MSTGEKIATKHAGERGTIKQVREPYQELVGKVTMAGMATFDFKTDGLTGNGNMFVSRDWEFYPERPTFQEQFEKLRVGDKFRIVGINYHAYIKLNRDRYSALDLSLGSSTAYPTFAAETASPFANIEVVE